MSVRYQQVTPRRLRAREKRMLVEAARTARKGLVNVIELATREQREVLDIDEAGIEVVSWVKCEPRDHLQSLYQALTWLQTAENSVRQTRVALERMVETTERQVPYEHQPIASHADSR